MAKLTCIELCAGAGGQSLGIEKAGFAHTALIDNDDACCATLRFNRPNWNVLQADLREMTDAQWAPKSVDLLAAGLPCPPFSIAGKQLGNADERDLFPAALAIIERAQPRAVMIENVKGFLYPSFQGYREQIRGRLDELGYAADWRLINASDFGVPQLRPRVIIVALRKEISASVQIPSANGISPPNVGETLYDLMAAGGWEGAEEWKARASSIAPTIVGGSKKHGGPDLGPTRARAAWRELGVDGGTIANAPPEAGFRGLPRLTVRMAARIQGFPDDWEFTGKKTAAYRQVGNAFPPPVAQAIGEFLKTILVKSNGVRVAV